MVWTVPGIEWPGSECVVREDQSREMQAVYWLAASADSQVESARRLPNIRTAVLCVMGSVNTALHMSMSGPDALSPSPLQ